MGGEVQLELTMRSGQPPHFTWDYGNGKYWRLVDGKRCEIWKKGGELRVTPGFGWVAQKLLRLDDDLDALYGRFVKDEHLAEAVRRYAGMRLTRSEPWESLVCYLCSINRNIPQIRKDVQKLMGEDGWMREPEEIAGMDLPSSLGFRKRFLKGSARMIAEGEVGLGRIGMMPHARAREELMRLPGVGPKVADCVLLFGYGKGEAFPADVWVKRAMSGLYGVKGERNVADYAEKKWGMDAGYVQQYLFMYAREALKPERKKSLRPALILQRA